MKKIADIENPVFGTTFSGRSGVDFIGSLLGALINLGILIGAVVFLFILIIGGIQWISSGGDKGSIESARSKVTNALTGIIILFGLFAILNIVNCFFGIGFDEVTIGPYQVELTGVVCPNSIP